MQNRAAEGTTLETLLSWSQCQVCQACFLGVGGSTTAAFSPPGNHEGHEGRGQRGQPGRSLPPAGLGP